MFDLREASLNKTDLRGAYLRNAKLSGAYMQGCDLRGAFLEGAMMESEAKTESELDKEFDEFVESVGDDEEKIKHYIPKERRDPADLSDAKLRNANLSEARLSDVKGLKSASLAGTNLT